MNKFILKTIENEEIYKINSNINYTSNIIGRSISLTNESVFVDEMIAQGGYGTVFKCRINNEIQALKKLCVNSVQKLLICIQEIYILKNTKSEHIMRFIDSIIYQSDSDIYDIFILTEFYRENLPSLMRSMSVSHRVFEEVKILQIMSHLIKAVACLHQALPSPIIHRDLKVENVLIAFPDRYVLCDFGSATRKEVRPCDVDRQDLQEEISQCTTLSYRSPEMTDLYFDGGGHLIGRKSDIWALGVLMYNICFFTLPFGDSILSIMSGNITVPDTPYYSNNLLKLLKFCLIRNPKERADIYQLSAVIFDILSEPNPIKNVEDSPKPCLLDISLPLKKSEIKNTSLKFLKKDRNENPCIVNRPISTSIKPRERPKPGDRASLKTTQSNSNSYNNLNLLQSKIKEDPCDEWSKNQSSISVLNDQIHPHTTKVDDLIDFNGTVNRKITQIGNISKSQSLGKNFGNVGPGQSWNVHQMISQSYQNVPCVPQQLYSYTVPNAKIMYNNSCITQCNRSPPVNPQQFYPINHTSAYSYGMNVGHRRLVSEPVGCVTTNVHPGGQITLQSGVTSASHGILQPTKATVPVKQTSVLHEFDPLKY